jgi:hypothetical protein
MSTRGVIYVYWGDRIDSELKRSIDSLKRIHPELPHTCFKLPQGSSLLNKAGMAELSPYDTTLFLDTDTVVLDRLDFGFEMAERHGLACCINECPWARRYADIGGDQIEYNTGVLFFTVTANPVFDAWKLRVASMDSSIVFTRGNQRLTMSHNDQAGFSQAIADTCFNPFVLPLNWNLRPAWHKTFFGPVKIWHDRSEVPMQLRFWNEDQCHPKAIIQYSDEGKG